MTQEPNIQSIASKLLGLGLFLIAAVNVGGEETEQVAKARTEGRVVFYTTMGIDTVRPVSSAFEKKYPFLKVDVLRGNSETLFNRVIIERQAGKDQADVVNNSLMPLLKDKRVLASYGSPEAESFGVKFKDSDGTWVGLVGNYYVIGYNTNLVPEAVAPRDWTDLTHPRWKGKIALDLEDYDWFGAMLEYLGQEKGKRLMEALGRQELNWRKGHSLLAQLVGAGEFPVALLYAHRTQLMKDRGAPVNWVKTSKPIVVSLNAVGILEKAAHPNAARLLLDFLLSPHGQRLLFEGGQIPLRPTAMPPASSFQPAYLELYPVSGQVMKRLGDYKREYDVDFKTSR